MSVHARPISVSVTTRMSPPRIMVQPPKGLEALSPKYLAKRRVELPRLLELLEATEFDPIRVAGHNMKGTGSGYGFPPITVLGAAIESAAKTKDSQTLKVQFDELGLYLESVCLVIPD